MSEQYDGDGIDHVWRLFHELAAGCMAARMVRYARSLREMRESMERPRYASTGAEDPYTRGHRDGIAEGRAQRQREIVEMLRAETQDKFWGLNRRVLSMLIGRIEGGG